MAQFSFKALSADGKTLTGTLEADSVDGAIAKLTRQGHYPISAERIADTRPMPSSVSPRRARQTSATRSWMLRRQARDTRLTRKQVLPFTRDLAHLLRAGIAIEQAIQTLARTTQDRRLRHATGHIAEALRAGRPFSEALKSYGPPFDAFYVSIIQAGEVAGALSEALDQLADYLHRSEEFASSVRLAAVYPTVLLVTTILSLTAILVLVVPQFETMFSTAGSEIPFHTRMILFVSRSAVSHGWILLAAGLLAAAAFLHLAKRPAVRRRLHRLALDVPMVGTVIRRSETARLARSLGTMLRNGVSITQAFDQSLPILRNLYIADQMQSVRTALRAGQGFADPLRATGVLSEMSAQMIRVGEESGNLAAMLIEVSTLLEQEVQARLKTMMAILEPAMIVTLGIVIGGIVLSIFFAIMSSYDLAL